MVRAIHVYNEAVNSEQTYSYEKKPTMVKQVYSKANEEKKPAIQKCCAMNGRYICFVFPSSTAEDGRSRGGEVKAYSVLMASSARELKLPSKLLMNYETGRGDLRLHNDIIGFLRERNLGFSPGLENTTGSQIVKCLTDALFYIQPHYKTLQARIPNFLPPYFSALFTKVYNDPKAHKHAVPQLKSVQLKKVSAPLYSILLLPMMMTRSHWHWQCWPKISRSTLMTRQLVQCLRCTPQQHQLVRSVMENQ